MNARRPSRASHPPPTVWGLDTRALHDRCWAAHGVRVVRRGCRGPIPAGPAVYLLLEPAALTLFDLPALLRRLPRRRGGCLRVHVVEPDGAPYSERVVADAAGDLVAVQRRYAARPRSGTHAGITRSPLLAAKWRGGAESAEAARRELRLAAGLHGGGDAAVPGMVFDDDEPGDAPRCAAQLLARWPDVGTTCPGIRCVGPGVWAHETAAIEPGARIVGPVWIGAGAFVAAGPPVVGPLIIADLSPPPPVPPPPPPLPAELPPVRCAWRAPAASEPAPRRAGTRPFDVALSVAALVLAAPLFPLIMLAIWLEDARPFFFAHVRQTQGGENFVCYKFRTMCRDAEKLKRHLASNNLCDGPQFHIDADPRLLRVGRVLRRFHLDELPQFFNVLLGQMAVIGPRPSPEDENRYCPAWRDARLSVKPGLTGLWQVSRTRAPQTDFQEWIRHDLDYVTHQTWGRDLLIIYKTTRNILGRFRPAPEKLTPSQRS